MKVLLITGATKGIGYYTALKFGENGYAVALNGRNEEDGIAAVKKLQDKGIEAKFYQADVTDENKVIAMVEEVGNDFGKIDVLINNAGGLGGRSSIEEMSTEFYNNVMDLNMTSVFYCSRAAIPFLKKSKAGAVLNLTSIAAYNGAGPGAGIYGVAKAGVLTFTRSLAKELIPSGIRVNAISPGTIDTPFHSKTDPALIEGWKKGIPAGRLGKAEEVADLAYFLASDQSSYIVGEVIQINGGQMFL